MQVKRAASSGVQWYQSPVGVVPRKSTLETIWLIYGDSGEPTSGLEPLTCSLRVITQALQGCAVDCKCRIPRPDSLLRVAACCTVLRSRWCQSGIT
jgi:hypothetical protein